MQGRDATSRVSGDKRRNSALQCLALQGSTYQATYRNFLAMRRFSGSYHGARAAPAVSCWNKTNRCQRDSRFQAHARACWKATGGKQASGGVIERKRCRRDVKWRRGVHTRRLSGREHNGRRVERETEAVLTVPVCETTSGELAKLPPCEKACAGRERKGVGS